jgi:hypothetical protein
MPINRLFILICTLLPVFGVADRSIARDQGIRQPTLSDQPGHSEYWEQQFLFEDDTFVTSQFVITNLPLSKQHGIQVGTLLSENSPAADGRVVIKNGRPRDGWHYDPAEQALTIFSHSLTGKHPGYLMRLQNTSAELDVLFSAREDAIELVAPGGPLGLPAVTLYAPLARAFARWRAGPEIGGAGQAGDWTRIGHGRGFGLHVRQTRELHETVSRWRRLTGTRADSGVLTPVLHQFVTPAGEEHTVLLLLSPFAPAKRLEDVALESTVDGSGWHLRASGGGHTLKGVITPQRPLDHFVLKDQLSGVEQLVAGASADVDRTQTLARYDLNLQGEKGPTRLTGTAIFEDIRTGQPVRKRNRRLR